KQPILGYRLPFPPTTGPTADDLSLYILLGDRVTAYALPLYELAPPATPPVAEQPKSEEKKEGEPANQKEGEAKEKEKVAEEMKPSPPPMPAQPPAVRELPTSFVPKQMSTYLLQGVQLNQPPVLAGTQVAVVSTTGS